jgi:hypothetical protein
MNPGRPLLRELIRYHSLLRRGGWPFRSWEETKIFHLMVAIIPRCEPDNPATIQKIAFAPHELSQEPAVATDNTHARFAGDVLATQRPPGGVTGAVPDSLTLHCNALSSNRFD